MNEVFKKLESVNVNGFTKKLKKQNTQLTYLSWSHAWSETKKLYPKATYEIKKFENGLPYVFDEKTGYMVFTSVTIEDLTHEMWLFVMDGANKAMKSERYTYTTKYGKKTVEPCTMFNINTTLMRCLTKNLAMHGLGLYIYAGEDLPIETNEEKAEKVREKHQEQSLKKDFNIQDLFKILDKSEIDIIDFQEKYKIDENNIMYIDSLKVESMIKIYTKCKQDKISIKNYVKSIKTEIPEKKELIGLIKSLIGEQ